MSHRRGVLRVAFRGDGRLLATGSFDGTARIWDAQTGWHRSPRPWCIKTRSSGLSSARTGSRLATCVGRRNGANLGCRHGRPARSAARAHRRGRSNRLQPGRTNAGQCQQGRHRASLGRGHRRVTVAADTVMRPRSVAWRFIPSGRVLLTACSDDSLAERAGAAVGNRQRATRRPSVETRRRSFLGRLQPGWLAAGDGQRRPDSADLGRDDGSTDHAPAAASAPGVLARIQPRWPPTGDLQRGRHARVWDAATGEPLSTPFPHEDETKIASREVPSRWRRDLDQRS